MIIFTNPGLLDIRAITTFGLNAKPNSVSPIGYFGTGLKYAFAVLARENCQVLINIGDTQYKLAKRASKFRDKDFEELFLEEQYPHGSSISLPFTTELGKNWKLWQAYRELYCNTKDENGNIEHIIPRSEEYIHPSTDTTIYVTSEEFDEIHLKRAEFIIPEDEFPVFTSEILDLYEGASPHIYYKGIRVSTLNTPYQYRINFKKYVNLTEDRTMSNTWDIRSYYSMSVLSSDNEDVIRKVVTSSDDFMDAKVDSNHEKSAKAMDIILDIFKSNKGRLNTDLCVWARKHLRDISVENITADELPKLYQKMLAKAKSFLLSIGHEVTEQIIYEEFLEDGALGIASKGKIYLSKQTFDIGQKQLIVTLLEEHLHCKHGFADCTREFQEFLLHRVITLGQELTQEIL